MTDKRIDVARPDTGDLSADPDLEADLRAHRRGSFLLRAAGAGNLYVARVDGAYAGGMVIGGMETGKAVFDGSFFGRGMVWQIWVEERFRRQGVASALMSRAEEDCPSDDLFTSTNQSNVPAQRLFEQLGFTRAGVVDYLDEGDPEIFYVKRVR